MTRHKFLLRKFPFVLFFVALLWLYPSNFALPDAGVKGFSKTINIEFLNIRGVITDYAQNPIDSIAVKITQGDEEKVLGEGMSRPDGSFQMTLKNLDLGNNAVGFPNPFGDDGTNFAYSIRKESDVEFTIYNILGQVVDRMETHAEPGKIYQVHWNGTNKNGKPVASGVYLARVEYDDGHKVIKLSKVAGKGVRGDGNISSTAIQQHFKILPLDVNISFTDSHISQVVHNRSYHFTWFTPISIKVYYTRNITFIFPFIRICFIIPDLILKFCSC